MTCNFTGHSHTAHATDGGQVSEKRSYSQTVFKKETQKQPTGIENILLSGERKIHLKEREGAAEIAPSSSSVPRMSVFFPSEGELQPSSSSRGLTSDLASANSAVRGSSIMDSHLGISSSQPIDARVQAASVMDSVAMATRAPPPAATAPGSFSQQAPHHPSFQDYYGAASMFQGHSGMDFTSSAMTAMNNNYLFRGQGSSGQSTGTAAYMDMMSSLPGAASAIGSCSRMANMANSLGTPMYPWMAIVGRSEQVGFLFLVVLLLKSKLGFLCYPFTSQGHIGTVHLYISFVGTHCFKVFEKSTKSLITLSSSCFMHVRHHSNITRS